MAKQYNCIGMGGTFDHLHRGHREFIAFAAGFAEKVVIGVTDSAMTENKLFPQLIESRADRTESVKLLCSEREISAEVVVLHDVYGPTVTSSKIDALAVTEETVAGGAAINAERVKQGLPPLPVHVFPLVRDVGGAPITSTRIRAGEIDREGSIYLRQIENGHTLTDEQRAFFAQPQGSVVTTALTEALAPTYVVGDICLTNFHENDWQFHAAWFDGKSQRSVVANTADVQSTQKINNPPGSLGIEAVRQVVEIEKECAKTWKQGFLPKFRETTFVTGEEDCIAICLALFCSLGSIIYYGQPNVGMMRVEVNESLKQSFYSLLASEKIE